MKTVEEPKPSSPGFGPPVLTENEIAWVEFLRLIGKAPTGAKIA